MSAAASAAPSSLMDVLHQGSDLVTSDGTKLLTGLPDGASVRLLEGAAVVGVEAGQETARFDFALGQVGAVCWRHANPRHGAPALVRRCPATTCPRQPPAPNRCQHPPVCPPAAARHALCGSGPHQPVVDGTQVGRQRRRGAPWPAVAGRWGQVGRACTRLLHALHRAHLPAAPTRSLQVPEETQFLLAELPAAEGGQAQGGFALLLPLIDGGAFRATLRPPTRCALQACVAEALQPQPMS